MDPDAFPSSFTATMDSNVLPESHGSPIHSDFGWPDLPLPELLDLPNDDLPRWLEQSETTQPYSTEPFQSDFSNPFYEESNEPAFWLQNTWETPLSVDQDYSIVTSTQRDSFTRRNTPPTPLSTLEKDVTNTTYPLSATSNINDCQQKASGISSGRFRIPKSARELFEKLLEQHPYPTKEEHEQLARNTSLTIKQVKTFLNNFRSRNAKKGMYICIHKVRFSLTQTRTCQREARETGAGR